MDPVGRVLHRWVCCWRLCLCSTGCLSRDLVGLGLYGSSEGLVRGSDMTLVEEVGLVEGLQDPLLELVEMVKVVEGLQRNRYPGQCMSSGPRLPS
jgi:hypothetical protein